MVFLALTRSGYDELVSQLQRVPSPLWVNKGVLSDEELAALRALGSVSDFTYFITPTNVSEVEEASYTVKEHHPNETVWVEYVPAP